MYTSVCLQLYVATSSSPLGPFVDPQLIQTQAIDPMFFEDDDGSLYLYYAKVRLGEERRTEGWSEATAAHCPPL